MTPAILYYAIPGFVLLLSIEAWFSNRENKNLYEKKDTWTSLALGMGNVLTGFITKAAVFGFFTLLYNVRIFSLPDTAWWFWVLLFFSDDFSWIRL